MDDVKRELLMYEFDVEYKRTQSYFEFMYKTVSFAFTALAALVVLAGRSDAFNNTIVEALLLSYLIPVCMYVFGIMYSFNAYALAVCGRRAEIIHNVLHKNQSYGSYSREIKKYIVSDRRVAFVAYGVPLGFFITVPIASLYVGMRVLKVCENSFLGTCLPIILFVIYAIFMLFLIIEIAMQYSVKDIQNSGRRRV